MSAQLNVAVILTEINCGCCGGTYAINERYRAHKAEKGGYWKCPYCGELWGYGDSELKRKERELAAEKERHRTTIARLNEAQQREQKLQRKLKRVDRGVCPECNRTFVNLARHMKCKHTEVA